MIKNYFPNNLIFLRKGRKLSQSSLAQKIGVDQTTIGRWEDGNREPTMSNISKLAEIFNVKSDDFMGKDLSKEENNFDETELLFDKYKNVLTDDDKETIKFLIEKRKKAIDEQLGDK